MVRQARWNRRRWSPYGLVLTIAAQSESAWDIFELFKAKFSGSRSYSSNASWAEGDLRDGMFAASGNAAVFISAFWAGCEQVRAEYPMIGLPDADVVNRILSEHKLPYEVRPPELLPRSLHAPIAVKAPEKSIGERAIELIQASLNHADRFLHEQQPRQAAQEILWLLETVSTAFQGCESGTGTIEGKYFNEIVRDLRKHNRGTALAEALGWMSKMHGYLSSPTGGGVRHGTQLAAGISPSLHEAQLYCNLTMSYINYLLAELSEMRQRSAIPNQPPPRWPRSSHQLASS